MNHKLLRFDILNNRIEPTYIKNLIEICKEKEIDISFDEYLKDFEANNELSPDEQHIDWIPFVPFQQFIMEIDKKYDFTLVKSIASELMTRSKDLYLEDEYKGIVNTILNLGSIYGHLIKGDKVGLWQVEKLSEGYVIVKENTALPCAFVEGYLVGLLKVQGAKGLNISILQEQNMESYFNVYKIAWMRNLVS